MQFNITFKTIFEYVLKKLVLCIQIRFVSTEKTTRIASRASCYSFKSFTSDLLRGDVTKSRLIHDPYMIHMITAIMVWEMYYLISRFCEQCDVSHVVLH